MAFELYGRQSGGATKGIRLSDVVALIEDLPEHELVRTGRAGLAMARDRSRPHYRVAM